MATVPLATYLWKRIYEVGIESIMGVPGDFNLDFLDHIYHVPGLKFIGNSNELNAAYAADGYGRIKKKPGCLVTTHGVGELSAINGIAGAASEHVPVIHIVGQTGKQAQENHLMIHHSIGFKPNHQLYNEVSKPLRTAAAELHKYSPADSTREIDRAIRECFIHHQPVYIFFPIDMTNEPVAAHLLDTKIDLSLPVTVANETAAINAITEALYSSKSPSVFVDFLAHGYGQQEAQSLVSRLGLPHYASHMGKGCVDEDDPNFVGLYNAALSVPGIAQAIEASDLVLALGWFSTDSNSAYFTRNLPVDRRIDIMPHHVTVQGKTFEGVYMAPLMAKLAAVIDPVKLAKTPKPKLGSLQTPKDVTSKDITQSWLWTRIGSLLRPGDIVLADTGTAAFGMPDAAFPKNVKYICQTYYGSIGYSTPSSLGCCLAQREKQHANSNAATNGTHAAGRTILLTGDGSLMLTMQEIGIMVAHKLPVLIVVINNAGYTIERAIHGARQPYNNIPACDYSKMLAFYGMKGADAAYRCAKTKEEFEGAWRDLASDIGSDGAPPGPRVLELKLDAFDIPWRLARLLNRRKPTYLRDEGFTNYEE